MTSSRHARTLVRILPISALVAVLGSTSTGAVAPVQAVPQPVPAVGSAASTASVREHWRTSPPATTPATRPVTFDVTVSSARTIKTRHIMVNVRNEADVAFPTAMTFGATIGSTGLRLTERRVFPPGRYRYRVGYQQGDTWVNVGPVRTFTVTDARAGSPWVMGYYVGYLKDQLPLDDVDWSSMTHVVVGAAVPRPDGSIDSTFYQQDMAAGHAWASAVVDRAHRKGRSAILMLGGAQSRDAFASAASPANRRAFVDRIVTTVDTLGFDGVDIDWEPMRADDGANVLALARELRARRPGIRLSIPVGPVNTNLPQNSVFPFMRDLASAFDQVNVMTYGMAGGWEGWQSWHNGALRGESGTTPMSVESSVRAYTAAGVPAKKLGIGIGFFGSCMSAVTGPRQSHPAMKLVADDNVMSYANIMKSYYRPEIARWDDVAKVPYLSSATPIGPAGCTFITYENERSIAEKAAYAKSSGLGGVIVWNINEGVLPGSRSTVLAPLTAALRAGFLR